jgi:hypothetical protein
MQTLADWKIYLQQVTNQVNTTLYHIIPNVLIDYIITYWNHTLTTIYITVVCMDIKKGTLLKFFELPGITVVAEMLIKLEEYRKLIKVYYYC